MAAMDVLQRIAANTYAEWRTVRIVARMARSCNGLTGSGRARRERATPTIDVSFVAMPIARMARPCSGAARVGVLLQRIAANTYAEWRTVRIVARMARSYI